MLVEEGSTCERERECQNQSSQDEEEQDGRRLAVVVARARLAVGDGVGGGSDVDHRAACVCCGLLAQATKWACGRCIGGVEGWPLRSAQ